MTLPKKKLSINELREEGYLQEANRQFFHPLGLSLMVNIIGENGEDSTVCILDNRHDLEGVVFGLEQDDYYSEGSLQETRDKAQMVAEQAVMRHEPRVNAIGHWIERIPGDLE